MGIAYQLLPPGLENAHLGEYRRARAQNRHGSVTEAGTGVSTSQLDWRYDYIDVD